MGNGRSYVGARDCDLIIFSWLEPAASLWLKQGAMIRVLFTQFKSTIGRGTICNNGGVNYLKDEMKIYLMSKTLEVFAQSSESSEPERHVKNARQTNKN